MARVLVLHARLESDGNRSVLTALLARLPYARRMELERRGSRDLFASLAGTWLVLEGASRLLGRPVAAGELRFPEGGKPILATGPYFSLSHGGTRVAAAVSESVDVGFDMEEAEAGQAGMSEYRARLERWTATEAVLKAAGRGLRDAQSVEIDASLAVGRLHGAAFSLRRVTIAESVIAHLAASRPIERVDVIEVDLPQAA